MEEIKNQEIFNYYTIPITIEKNNIITEQMKNCICKIDNRNGQGTGFFCYIFYQNEKIPFLIASNTIVNEEIIRDNKNIIVTLNDNEKKNIEINNSKKIYMNTTFNLALIEVNPQEENIKHFLELDENINENQKIGNKNIYIIHYPKYEENKQQASVSYGTLNKINDYDIKYYCYTKSGSIGSPILSFSTNKVIGIHNENNNNEDSDKSHIILNKGILFNKSIYEEILANKIKININEKVVMGPETEDYEEIIENKNIKKGPDTEDSKININYINNGPETSDTIINKTRTTKIGPETSDTIINKTSTTKIGLETEDNEDENINNKMKPLNEKCKITINSKNENNIKINSNKKNENLSKNINNYNKINNSNQLKDINKSESIFKNKINSNSDNTNNSYNNSNNNSNNNNSYNNSNNNNSNNSNNCSNIHENDINNINSLTKILIKKFNKEIQSNPNKKIQEESFSFSRYKKVSKIGLKNLGDTSYLNATFQLLGNIEAFAQFFLNPKNVKYIDENKNNLNLSLIIKDFFLTYYPFPEKENFEIYDPSYILYTIGKINNIYNNMEGKNPNELIIFILNTLHNELNLLKNKNQKINPNIYNKENVIFCGIQNFQNSNKSIISDLLNWFEIKKSQCMNCRAIMYSFLTFNTFKLNILGCYNNLNNKNNFISIYDCLNYQRMDKQKNLFCNNCRMFNKMVYSSNIFCTPNYLLFLLDRGNFNINLLNIHFCVQERIDLRNFLENTNILSQYELIGILSAYPQQRKYISFCKSPVDKQWYLYNDENIIQLQISDVINSNNSQFVPCVLIYKNLK